MPMKCCSKHMFEFDAIALSPCLTLLRCCPFVLNQLDEGSKAESLQAQRCRARQDHLESANAESSNIQVTFILLGVSVVLHLL